VTGSAAEASGWSVAASAWNGGDSVWRSGAAQALAALWSGGASAWSTAVNGSSAAATGWTGGGTGWTGAVIGLTDAAIGLTDAATGRVGTVSAWSAGPPLRAPPRLARRPDLALPENRLHLIPLDEESVVPGRRRDLPVPRVHAGRAVRLRPRADLPRRVP